MVTRQERMAPRPSANGQGATTLMAASMSIKSSPLHLQTVDSLFANLISGNSISSGEQGAEFRLDSSDSRAILNWYRLNRGKWEGNVQARDIELMVSAVDDELPVGWPAAANHSQSNRRLRLTKLVAHRFAGIHTYGTPEHAPPDFVFEPREPITLFDGWNGAGKTSLLNAIIWCLTGEIIRPQRRPERSHEEFGSVFVRTVDGVAQSTPHSLTPITPLPNPKYYVPPVGAGVPLDTWVELTFCDEKGEPLPPVRRNHTRDLRGKVSESASGFESLGVDPISMRLGTLLPAVLQYLRVGSSSDLGLAAAKLTGLADVADLAKHATKSKERISGELRKNCERKIKEADDRFLEARGDLQRQLDEFPDIRPSEPLPTPSESKDLNNKLEVLERHFQALKAGALAGALAVLGPTFDPNDKKSRDGLEADIGPAQGQLKALMQLPSVRRSRSLGQVAELDWRGLDKLLGRLYDEAQALAELAKTPALSRRKQLYARVAGWMSDTKIHDASNCAVCSRSLENVFDPISRRPVSEHLSEVSAKEQKLLSQTIKDWVAGWLGILSSECPSAIRAELTLDLPAHPSDLIRDALVTDLFDTPAFQETLSALKRGVQILCDQELPNLPTFTEPTIAPLPFALEAVAAKLNQPITRLLRAKAFAGWRQTNSARVVEVTKKILDGEEGGSGASLTENTPINRKLDSLALIVKGAMPLNAALELCKRLIAQINERRDREARLILYNRTSDALSSVIALGSLAEVQVEGLRKRLHVRTSYWRDRCYQNSFPMAGLALRETAMNVKGVLEIQVGFPEAGASAQHISNASALRASLMGFYLAFWEYVLKERGGICLLILDDPQDLLDHDNKEKLARLLPDLVNIGGQILVATYDRSFARAVSIAGRARCSIDHRSVHPVNPSRSTLTTAAAVEDLERKRNAYLQDVDSAAAAQEYVNELRIFVEARLADLFDDPAYPAYSTYSRSATLSDHLGHLRSLANSPPNAFFRGKGARALCDCNELSQGAECLRLLNQSHHDKASISPGDVAARSIELETVRDLTEQLHIEFRHWRWHEPLEESFPPINVQPFRPTQSPAFEVTIYRDLAAFTRASVHTATQDVSDESLSGSWFSNKALFFIRTTNFGFALPEGCVAIVECQPYEGKDHDLVIARQHGHLLARRLLRAPKGRSVVLAAETPDPRQSKPTLQFEFSDIALHRVVGMLVERPSPPLGKGEALAMTTSSFLSKVETAYRVRDESGVPLALPGQIVLGGSLVSKDRFSHMRGALVALSLEDGSNVFKRVGNPVPDSRGLLWQFESIGGLGESLVVSMAQDESESKAPRLISAREVLGVLYGA